MFTLSKRRVIVFALLVLLLATAQETIPEAVIEVFPEELILPAQGAVRSTLILRNSSDHVLQNVRVDPDELPGVQIDITPQEPQSIPPHSAATWDLAFSQAVSGTIEQQAHFVVRYRREMDGDVAAEEVSVASVTLSSRPQEEASSTAEVQVHSSLTELNDFRPGYLYIEIKNRSAGILRVREIQIAERPGFIILKSSVQGDEIPATQANLPVQEDLEIPPGESRVIPVYVESGDQVRPGKHLLVFNVRFERTLDGEVRTGSLLASHAFEAKVFGEGEVLGAIANVTSFLILPGFLLVLMIGMVWGLFVPGSWRDRLKVGPTTLADARFWVIAVTFSLLMAWQIYPLASRLLPIGERNYLYGYSFLDIIWMWLISIAIGAGFSLAAAGVAYLVIGVTQTLQRIEAGRAFRQNDPPPRALSKATHKGVSGLNLQEVGLKDSGARGYLLEVDSPEKEVLWVMPRIRILYDEDDAGLRDRIQDLMNEEDQTLKDLVELLDRGREMGPNKGIYAVEWMAEEALSGPQPIERANLDFGDQVNNYLRHQNRPV